MDFFNAAGACRSAEKVTRRKEMERKTFYRRAFERRNKFNNAAGIKDDLTIELEYFKGHDYHKNKGNYLQRIRYLVMGRLRTKRSHWTVLRVPG